MQPVDVGAVLLRAAHGGDSLSKDQIRELQAVVESGKVYLVHRAHDLLSCNSHAPALFQYSGDCTPLRVRTHASYGMGGPGKKVSSKVAAEYYA